MGNDHAMDEQFHLTASLSSSGTNFNKFYLYAKTGRVHEYFPVENRQKSGRDANLLLRACDMAR